MKLTNTVPVSSYRVTTCPLFRYSSSFRAISQVFLPLCRFLQVSPQELPAVVCVCACVKLFCTFLTIAARNKGMSITCTQNASMEAWRLQAYEFSFQFLAESVCRARTKPSGNAFCRNMFHNLFIQLLDHCNFQNSSSGSKVVNLTTHVFFSYYHSNHF